MLASVLAMREPVVLQFTGRVVIPSFVIATVLAALAFAIGSLKLALYSDLDLAAMTFVLSFIAGVLVPKLMDVTE